MHVHGAEDYRFYTWQVGAVLMVIGAFLAGVGLDVVRRFGPAFLVLVFLVPMPRQLSMLLTVPMMTGGAVATDAILSTAGIGVERSGNLLSINGVEVTVEEACAGMRGVWALTLVAVAFAFATPLRTWVRVAVLLSAPVLALVCNIIRLVPTVWVYGNSSAEAADTFHDLAGWGVLFIGYALLTGIVWLLEVVGVETRRSPTSGSAS
jgi:exosortase